MRVLSSAVIGTFLSLSAGSISIAAELTVLTNLGSGPGVRALAAEFSRTSGHQVTVLQETDNALSAAEQRLGGITADLVSHNPSVIGGLTKQGKLIADSVAPFTRAGLGVSVRAGAPKPDISTVEAYRATLLAAKSIGYSGGCSGQNAAAGIAELGLTEQLKPKIQVTGATGPVTFFLARGDFEIGIQQSNIMVGAPGTDYVGALPGAMNKPCPFRVGVVTVSKQQDAARAMIRFMISPEAAPLLRKAHEEPANN